VLSDRVHPSSTASNVYALGAMRPVVHKSGSLCMFGMYGRKYDLLAQARMMNSRLCAPVLPTTRGIWKSMKASWPIYGTTGNGKGTVLALEIQRKSLFSKTSGRRDKVRDRIANPGSVVRIGNKNHFRVLATKNTTLQKGRLPGSAALEETPHRTGFEKGFNAKRGTPVKIARSILSIAEASANRNDSLMLIVSERNKT